MTTSLLTRAKDTQSVLTDLSAVAQGDLHKLVSALSDFDQKEKLAYITDAYPEMARPYLSVATDIGMSDYAASGPGLDNSRLVRPGLLTDDAMSASGRWAMLQNQSFELLAGSLSRAIFNQHRVTTLTNIKRETGAKFARYSSANACGFCRMLATRGAVYTSEAKAAGRRYHDNCKCMAVAQRPGTTYTAPSYVDKWSEEYKKISIEAGGDPAKIIQLMSAI